MPRLLHTADVHLGARHSDLGERATAQRERQFLAFRATIDCALDEHVDLVLIAGDLFDSNTQPKRVVERVAAELKRLADARIRVVIIPGTHDVYDRSSIYRAHDLVAMAGLPADTDLLTVLTPTRPDVVLPALDTVVFGRVFPTKRAPHSPLAGFDATSETRATWRIGMIHGAVQIPGKVERDEVMVTREEIAASGLDYLALGHWHSSLVARADGVQYAYSGAPEPVAVDQDAAGKVLLVTLGERAGHRTVTVEERRVGRTRFEHVDVDATSLQGQQALVDALLKMADPDLVLDVRLTGIRPDELDLDVDEIEAAVAPAFLRVRLRDRSVAGLSSGPLPPADTIVGAFIRDVEAHIAELEASRAARGVALDGRDAGSAADVGPVQDDAAELRDVLRLGRLLLAGHEVTL